MFDDFAQQVYIKVVYLNHSKVMFAVNLKNTFICLYIYNARMHNYLYMSVASCWRKKIFRHILENVLSLATSIWFQIFKIFLHKLYTEKTFERGGKKSCFACILLQFNKFWWIFLWNIWNMDICMRKMPFENYKVLEWSNFCNKKNPQKYWFL